MPESVKAAASEAASFKEAGFKAVKIKVMMVVMMMMMVIKGKMMMMMVVIRLVC